MPEKEEVLSKDTSVQECTADHPHGKHLACVHVYEQLEQLLDKIDRLNERHNEAVTAIAVDLIGHVCPEHMELVRKMGFQEFQEFYDKHPLGCEWCTAAKYNAIKAIIMKGGENGHA